MANEPGVAGWPDADKVFEKYYRSPNARRMAGTGLGLYLVRSLVHKLGAKVSYAPDGTHVHFRVDMPVRMT